MNQERKRILSQLAEGKITADEAEEQLHKAAPTTLERTGQVMHSISIGAAKVGRGIGRLAENTLQNSHPHSEVSKDPQQVIPEKEAQAFRIRQDAEPGQMLPTVKRYAKEASVTAAASGLMPGAGPTVAAMASAGFVLSMLHKINSSLGITLPKEEMKPIADAIVHTVTPKDTGKYVAASGLSFIPVVGNVAAGAIMASTCYSITYAAGVVYLKTIERLMAQNMGSGHMTGSDVEAAASQIIASEDMAQIFADAQKSYEADKAKAAGSEGKEDTDESHS